MKRQSSFGFYVTVAVVIGILVFAVVSQRPAVVGRGNSPHRRGDLDVYYSMKAVLSTVNAFLLIVLSSIYLRVYEDTGLEFSLGLVIFSVALLLYSLVSNPLLVSVVGFSGSGLGPFAMLPDLFTCIASFILLYISR